MTESCHNCSSTDLLPLYCAPAFDVSIPQMQGIKQFELARCSVCGLVNTLGISAADVGATYTDDYYGSGSSKFLPVIEWGLNFFATREARLMVRKWRFGRIAPAPPSVLDIGCGRGLLLRAFRAMGSEVLGLERAEFPMNASIAEYVSSGAITDPAFRDREFDIVILRHVLEHLDGQEALLDSITQKLRDGGLLVIEVPNFSSLQQELFTRYWFHLDLPRHLVHLETDWLERQLRERAYRLESISHWSPIQSTYGFIQSCFNAISPGHLNELYHILKFNRSVDGGHLLRLSKWAVLTIPLLPAALLEGITGALFHRGATVKVAARKEHHCDQW